MGKQSMPHKAKRGNAGHMERMARGENASQSRGSSSSSKKKLKHGGVGAGNAFENLTYRSKHEVLQLGKPKGKLKRPAASLSHSLAQRQQSLLAEFTSREKANSFVDERLAEMNGEMDVEDKLLLRFQKERQSRMSASGARFSMGEDTLQLTHEGQALSTERRPRYDEEGKLENQYEETEEQQAEELARRAEAGEEKEGDEDGAGHADGHNKSRHEVMSEVMLKSKMFRAERAVKAGEQEDLQGQLDADFDAIRMQMEFVTQRERDAAKREARDAEIAAKAAQRAKAKSGDADETMEIDPADGIDPTDEFVHEARQLGLDIRARASDRLKSDEELIAQEKKRLERLEKQRVKRMRGEVDGDAAEDEGDDDEPSSKRRRREKDSKSSKKDSKSAAARKPTDDDLDANFVLTGSAVGAARDETDLLSDDEGGGGDESESDEDDDSEEGEDEEDEDDDDGGVGPALEEEEEQPKAVFIGSKTADTPAEKKSSTEKPAAGGFKEIFIGKDGKSSVSSALLAINAKLAGKADGGAAASSTAAAKKPVDSSTELDDSLPFTFPCPTTYKEFRTLLSQYPSRQHSVIIHRIKTVHHVSLGPENRGRMEKFYAILLTHFRKVAQEFERRETKEKTEDAVAEMVKTLDELGRHIIELTELASMNAVVGRAFRAQLAKIRGEFTSEEGDSAIHGDQLMLLKFVSNVFPTSDFRHNIVTPSLLLECEMLSRSPILGPGDIVRGFFVVSLLLHDINASKRFVPEILTFLHAALVHGCGIQRTEQKAPAAAATKGGKQVAQPTSEARKVGEDVFSVTPTPARLHASLQSRQMNFVPSSSLAVWTTMLQAKGSKKATDDAALHLPLQWLFYPNDAPVLSQSVGQIALFSTLLQLVHQSAQLWQSLPSYAELFTPLMDVFGHVLAQQKAGVYAALPHTLQQYTHHLHQYLSGSIAHSISLRVPLAASLAPLALKQHNPLFVEGYNPTKDYDPVKERAAQKELSHKLKREKKGALRELRRDTAVVVTEQRKIQAAYAAEREVKRKQVWAQQEEQQADTNILARASKKAEKKKDGGKKKK